MHRRGKGRPESGVSLLVSTSSQAQGVWLHIDRQGVELHIDRHNSPQQSDTSIAFADTVLAVHAWAWQSN